MKYLGHISDPKDIVTKEYLEKSLGLSRATVSIDSADTSTVEIPISVEDPNSLTVYQNGLLLTPTVHYTFSEGMITLVGHTAEIGDIFTFVSNAQTSTTLNAEASMVLFSDTTEDNCYGECSTVQDALMHAAEWQPTITEIQVNGSTVVPVDKVASINVPVVDDKISTDSENAVQNKVIAAELDEKLEDADFSEFTNAEILNLWNQYIT